MKTVHIIFNSHIDPIWLWSWRDGLDEVLNTCRYICGLLDRNPDIIYTRGEAWVYEKILQIDPELFERIREHVRAGRWSVVGGWYIQPDCNQPSGFAMQRQIELGKKFFVEQFGHFPKTGYNVDSFGHAATLPRLMSEAGQTSYIMMRPQEHEMSLPANLFRWKEKDGGPEITTFRIASSYCEMVNVEAIQRSLAQMPDGVDHTMCFVGIGDHGGGPTQKMIDWCRENRKGIPEVELVFSSPEKFFSTIQPYVQKLPVVIGELQQHAVGCYTVHHRVKSLLRRTEHQLVQAENILSQSGDKDRPGIQEKLRTAWERVCFHHFHDTLGGTCLPSAYPDVEAQLGQAQAIADEESTMALRRMVTRLPDDVHQRLVFMNASEKSFDDYVEIEPWFDWAPWKSTWGLADEKNELVPYQILGAESGVDSVPPANQIRLLFRMQAEPGERRIFRIVEAGQKSLPAEVRFTESSIRGSHGFSVDVKRIEDGLEFPGSARLPLPLLALYDDPTDTWSHGLRRYERQGGLEAQWEAPFVEDCGPLMASVIQRGRIGASELLGEWRVYHGLPWIEWRLRINWCEKKRILKLEWNLPKITEREDGILGGTLVRPTDGRELPLRDWVRLRTQAGHHLAIIAPEVYALDVDPGKVGLTLLRGAVLACHDPNPGTHLRSVYSDRGETTFCIRFAMGENLNAEALDRVAYGMQRSPLHAEITKGMHTRPARGEYLPLPLQEPIQTICTGMQAGHAPIKR
jgi:alpha-mannosidase